MKFLLLFLALSFSPLAMSASQSSLRASSSGSNVQWSYYLVSK